MTADDLARTLDRFQITRQGAHPMAVIALHRPKLAAQEALSSPWGADGDADWELTTDANRAASAEREASGPGSRAVNDFERF